MRCSRVSLGLVRRQRGVSVGWPGLAETAEVVIMIIVVERNCLCCARRVDWPARWRFGGRSTGYLAQRGQPAELRGTGYIAGSCSPRRSTRGAKPDRRHSRRTMECACNQYGVCRHIDLQEQEDVRRKECEFSTCGQQLTHFPSVSELVIASTAHVLLAGLAYYVEGMH